MDLSCGGLILPLKFPCRNTNPKTSGYYGLLLEIVSLQVIKLRWMNSFERHFCEYNTYTQGEWHVKMKTDVSNTSSMRKQQRLSAQHQELRECDGTDSPLESSEGAKAANISSSDTELP